MGGGYGGGARLEGKVCMPAGGSRRTKPVKSRVPNFSRKNGTLLLYFFGGGAQGDRYGMWCPVLLKGVWCKSCLV